MTLPSSYFGCQTLYPWSVLFSQYLTLGLVRQYQVSSNDGGQYTRFTILIKNNKDTDEDTKEEDTTEVFKVEVNKFSVKDFKLGLFDELIDVRTPEEFSKDRIHGAVNIPTLTNDQRDTFATSTDIDIVTYVGCIRERGHIHRIKIHIGTFSKK